ncbi:Cupin superfamily protein [Micromonospora coriariae]|uniref:Cupin superfamily protein n=1 Tax=Micromonospora coriariae TaxID=285665 RepID=A0A1C4XD62_9ACTN|nr:cupin domain-containing protein [Micromonospora coriariae]SCF06264.1 Cupin superfamily protein [Micromonospora coriariae]
MHDIDIASLFAPLSLDQFLTEKLGKEPYHCTGSTDRFVPLLDWDALNRLLSDRRWEYPRFRLAQNGQDLPPASYSTPGPSGADHSVLSVREIACRVRGGASLVVDAIDEIWPPVRSLAEDLEHALGEYVKVNAYASWTQEPGFDHHWDDHDVIVLQVSGSKRWSLFGEARRYPLRRDVDPNLSPPCGEVATLDIKAGDVLHVPRGHWHAVSTIEGPSLHLTVGITQRTAVDYLHWLADHLTSNEFMRQPLPRYSSADLATHSARIADLVARESEASGSINAFLAEMDALAPARQRFSLPSVDRDAVAESLVGAQVVWVPSRFRVYDESQTVTVRANGLCWRFHEEAQPLIRLLTSRTPVAVDDLARSGDDVRTRFLLADLIMEGLVTIVADVRDQP